MTVRLWDPATGKELQCLRGHRGPIFAVRYSPDGTLLASTADDGTLRLWDPRTGREIRQLQGPQPVHGGLGLAFSPDGKTVAAGFGWKDPLILLWDTGTWKQLRAIHGHSLGVLGLVFSPDGRFLASASADETLGLWDVATGGEIRRLNVKGGWVNNVSFSPDGKTLVSGCQDGAVREWEAASGRELRVLGEKRRPDNVNDGGVNSLAFSPDGRTLAYTDQGSAIRLWDLTSGRDLNADHHGHVPFDSIFAGRQTARLLQLGRNFPPLGCRYHERNAALSKAGPWVLCVPSLFHRQATELPPEAPMTTPCGSGIPPPARR